MNPTLRFDADRHEYWLGERRLPSVTEILESAATAVYDRGSREPRYVRLVEPEWFSPESADRGTAVHQAAALLLQGHDLDPESIDERVAGYVESLRRWVDRQPRAEWTVEAHLCCDAHNFAGTPDAFSLATLVDFKTGAVAKWHALQTAAYAWLTRKLVYGSGDRICVYLDADGGEPMIARHTSANDWPEFAALCGAWWTMRNRCAGAAT